MDATAITETDFHFPGQQAVYHGKVRDVYDLGDSLLFAASDRYSAFDRNLAIVPHKGEMLTAISRWWFEQTSKIIPNHIVGYPDPNVTWGKKCEVVPLEMVVRGYITGVTNTSLWHTYSEGQRDYGSFNLPDGLRKNDALPQPVLTPTTKFEIHDRNITVAEAIQEGLVKPELWEELQAVTLELFTTGQRMAAERGLILVDTKYEFGLDASGALTLIDEIHTPDSSRYWRADTYRASLDAGQEPDNYDKEYLRLWYKERFDPYAAGPAPEVPDEVIAELAKRYMYVYQQLLGRKFEPRTEANPLARIEANVNKALGEQHAAD